MAKNNENRLNCKLYVAKIRLSEGIPAGPDSKKRPVLTDGPPKSL